MICSNILDGALVNEMGRNFVTLFLWPLLKRGTTFLIFNRLGQSKKKQWLSKLYYEKFTHNFWYVLEYFKLYTVGAGRRAPFKCVKNFNDARRGDSDSLHFLKIERGNSGHIYDTCGCEYRRKENVECCSTFLALICWSFWSKCWMRLEESSEDGDCQTFRQFDRSILGRSLQYYLNLKVWTSSA